MGLILTCGCLCKFYKPLEHKSSSILHFQFSRWSVRTARAHNRARSLASTSSCTCIMDRKLPLTKINQCNKRPSYASINYDFSFLLILSTLWLYVHVLYDMDMLPVFSLKNRQARNLASGPQSSSPQPANSSPQPAARSPQNS